MQNHDLVTNLEVRDLHKSFKGKRDLPVLGGISFTAEPGKVLAILGKSGTGKTTLLNIISGLEKPNSGSVTGVDTVSYTTQRDLLLPWRTVEANVLLPFEIRKNSSKEVGANISSQLDAMELGDFKKSYPDELSGGMRQKVALVRSLVQDVPVYLFDEALSAIDFDSRLKLAHGIRNYIRTRGKVGIFITHNIEEAISIADTVLVLSSRPATIIHESQISISENERDPIALRKNPVFQSEFEKLWKVMAQI